MTEYRKCPKCNHDTFTEGNTSENYYELTCNKCKTILGITHKIIENVEIIN